MKKILCICNTYYQLILAMQMKKTVYKDAYMTLLLSDHSKNALQICNRLERSGFFNEVHFFETKTIDFSDELKPFADGRKIKETLMRMNMKSYDELLAYNLSKTTFFVFHYLCKQNKNIRVHRFEEGVLSYGTPIYKGIPITNFWYINTPLYPFLKLAGSFDLIKRLDRFYCCYPKLYTGALEACQIPPIQAKSDVAELVTGVFGVNKEELHYDEKYIFFTSVYDFEGGAAIKELELVRAVSNVVGKENLLIKMHPRDTRSVYADEGFHIDTNSSIPFEALLFAFDFRDKVLLTATSGAVLSASLLLEHPPKAYYMYPLCELEGNPPAKNTTDQIDGVLRHESFQSTLDQIRICNSIDEIICGG